MVIKVKGARFQTFLLLGAQCSWQDINVPNKQSSTKRLKTDTAINFNNSTNCLKKPIVEQLPVILLLHCKSITGETETAGPQQQYSEKFTGWGWEELECVDNTDAAAPLEVRSRWRQLKIVWSFDWQDISEHSRPCFIGYPNTSNFVKKYSAASRISNSLLGVWISRWNSVSRVWYITSRRHARLVLNTSRIVLK